MTSTPLETTQPLFVQTIFDDDNSHLDAPMIIDLITMFDSGDPYYGKVGIIARNRTKALLEIERVTIASMIKLDKNMQSDLAKAEERLEGYLTELQNRLKVESRSSLPQFGAALADEIELVYSRRREAIHSKCHLLQSWLAAASKERIVDIHELAVERLEALQQSGAGGKKASVKNALHDARMALKEAKDDLGFQKEICSSLVTKKRKQMKIHQRPSLVGVLELEV